MQTIRTEQLLGSDKVIVGNKYTDLVLETLGKVYIKTGNKAVVLNNLILSLMGSNSSSRILFVSSTSEMEEMEYPGDGMFIYNKLTDTLYISLDNRYIQLIQASPDGFSGYVKKQGDTMSGQLEIITDVAPLIVASSLLVKNFNAEYLNGYTSDDFAKKKFDEYIYGNWTFRGKNVSENNWIFKENTRFYRDIVTSGSLTSPEFSGGFGGYGWRLDGDTNTLTIDNLVVRKVMQVYEMVINQISATNGSLWVSNSAKCHEVFKPIIVTKELIDSTSVTSLGNIFETGKYYLITDTDVFNLTINRDTNNLGSATEEDIGVVTENKSLSTASYINKVSKTFINYKYLIYINDLSKLMSDSQLTRSSLLYDETYLNNAEYVNIYYIYKQNYVAKWDSNNNPLETYLISTFNKDEGFYTIPSDTQEVVKIKPFYKYFGLKAETIQNVINSEDTEKYVPKMFVFSTDPKENPTLKAGDIIRCLKFEDNNIKYYDGVITAQIKTRTYIVQLSPSVFDTYTEISYNEDGSLKSKEEKENTLLYNKTSQSFNANTGLDLDKYSYESSEEKSLDKLAEIAVEDDLILMGNIYNTLRQNAIYITSTDDLGPYIDVLSGLNRPDYSVIYNLPTYKKIKVFIKLKGDIFVEGEADDYFYQKENPGAINFNQKPSFITNSKKFPLVYITIEKSLEEGSEEETDTTEFVNIFINDGETNTIPSDTSEGYFITNYPTQYSIKDLGKKSTKITKTRLGNLDGIYNEIFKDKLPYGYGLYSENVFLTGEFYLNNGKSIVEFTEELIKLEITGSISKNYILNSKGPFEVKNIIQEDSTVIEFSKLFLLKKFTLIGADMYIHWQENYTGKEETPPHVRAFLRFKDSEIPNLEVFNNTTFKPTEEFDAIIFKGNNFEGTIEKLMLSLGSTKYEWEPAELDAIGSSFEMTENGITLVGKEILLKGLIKFEYLDNLTLDNLNYLTKNLKDATKESTLILGGLILTNTIALGESSSIINEETLEEEKIFKIYSGISGNYDSKQIGGGISYWSGGDAFDKESMPEELYPEGIRPAKSLLRMDGTGYLANGNITWDSEGNLKVNPLTFWININNGEYLTLEELLNLLVNLFSPIYKEQDNPKSPIIGIYAKYPMAVLGGVTVYTGIPLSLPSIFDGLPIDNDTIYWELDETGLKAILKAKGGNGGEIDSNKLWQLLDANTSEQINKSHLIDALNGYATQSWVKSLGYLTNSSLNGYATEDWVTNKGYLTSSALNGYTTQSWVTSNFLGISDTAVNADKIDGYHASDLLTSMSSSRNTNLSITVGGHTESLSTLHVDYAWQLENTRTIWGQNFDGTANVSGDLSDVGDINGSGTFYSSNSQITNNLYIGGIRLYKSQTSVITIDGDLAVTGGITAYAQGSRTPSTIMDGVAVDGTTIKKVNGVLVATGGSGGGGSTAWGDITGKPSWITTSKPNVSYFTNDAGYITQSQLGNTYVKKAGDAMTGALSTPEINGGGRTLLIGNSGNKSYVKFQEDVKQLNGNWSISNSGSASFASVSASGVVRGDGGFITNSVTMLKLSRYAYQEVLTYGWTSTYGDFVDLKIPGSSQQTKYVKLSWNRGFEAFCNVVVNGNITATGGITGNTSDQRAKTILEELNISLKDIADAPTIRFKWNGWKIQDDGKTHIGGLAQYMQDILPEVVLNEDDMLYMDYSTTAYIFSVQTAKHLANTNTEIDKLKERVKKLEKQLKQLGYEETNIMDDKDI